MRSDIRGTAFVNAVATGVYVVMVALFFTYVKDFFPEQDTKTVFIPIFMLLLFILSASITGFLVLGRPILWYLDGKKKEALSLFGTTLGFLVLFAVAALLIAWRSVGV